MRNFTVELNQSMVDRELTKLSGQITKLRKGNVETVELISGENLLPPVDPVERYLETKKLNELKEINIPITRAIEEIRSEVSGLRPIENVNRDPPAIEQNEGQIPIDNDPPKVDKAFLTDETKRILRKEVLHPDIVFDQKEFERWYRTDRQKTISNNTKNIKQKRG